MTDSNQHAKHRRGSTPPIVELKAGVNNWVLGLQRMAQPGTKKPAARTDDPGTVVKNDSQNQSPADESFHEDEKSRWQIDRGEN